MICWAETDIERGERERHRGQTDRKRNDRHDDFLIFFNKLRGGGKKKQIKVKQVKEEIDGGV